MKVKTFISQPTALALQLSALTRRPVIFKQQPVITLDLRQKN